jgi:copper chaperone CopZ/thiol-disulfide isomerase/thioredoxin
MNATRALGVVAIALASAPIACASRPVAPVAPEGTRTVALSARGLDCADCATKIDAELRKVHGVYDVSFDKARVVFSVVVAPDVSTDALVAAVKAAGYDAVPGDRGGEYLPTEAFPADADVVFVVQDGRDVKDLDALSVDGKVTVVDLFAPWCGPCREVDAHMKGVLEKRHDVAYRKLDVVDWDSPLAKHWLANVPELPYVVVLAKDGHRVDAVSGLDLARLDAAIERGTK